MELRTGRLPIVFWEKALNISSPCLRITSRSWRSWQQPRRCTVTVPRRSALNSSPLRWPSWSRPTSQVKPSSSPRAPFILGLRGLIPWLPCSLLPAVQFEGSLGKLTVSSVNNPRKMIDAVVTSRSEDDVSSPWPSSLPTAPWLLPTALIPSSLPGRRRRRSRFGIRGDRRSSPLRR